MQQGSRSAQNSGLAPRGFALVCDFLCDRVGLVHIGRELATANGRSFVWKCRDKWRLSGSAFSVVRDEIVGSLNHLGGAAAVFDKLHQNRREMLTERGDLPVARSGPLKDYLVIIGDHEHILEIIAG